MVMEYNKGMGTCNVLLIVSLRCHSHTMQPAHLKRTVQWCLACSWSCVTTTTVSFRTFL